VNQTELIARVRRTAFIRDNHPDFTDQVILDELNDALRSIYEDIITGPRQGHWLKQYIVPSTVGQQSMRITPRAVVGGLEKVEIGEIGNQLWSIQEITENHAQWYESFSGRLGTPQYFVIRGDMIDFLPSFDHAMSVRISYYIRPSIIVLPQANPIATAGLVTLVNPATREVTLSAPAFVKNPNNPQLGTSVINVPFSDFVHPNGTFELSAVDLRQPSAVGLVMTFPAGTDVSDVQVGDFWRCSQETDWPPLPEEFHRTVSDTAAVKIMLELNMSGKAGMVAQSTSGDLARLRTLMSTSRVRNSPKTIGLSMITFGGGKRIYPRFP
jgi:hypothetical protein